MTARAVPKPAAVIIAAAGSGQRLGVKTPKPYIRLAGKPLLAYSLERFAALPEISQIVVAAEVKFIRRAENLARRTRGRPLIEVVAGGRTRSESVSRALSRILPETPVVLVHDAARPLVPVAMIRRCIGAAEQTGAAVCVIPCESTIKQAAPDAGVVAKTLDRSVLWQAQTPQGFRTGLLQEAYARWRDGAQEFPDDASLVESLGYPVRLVAGSRLAMKITTKEDLIVARAMVSADRTGLCRIR